MTTPAPRTLLLLAAALAVALLPALGVPAAPWREALGLAGVALLVDLLRLWRAGVPAVRATVPRSLAVGREEVLGIAVGAAGLRPGTPVELRVELEGPVEAATGGRGEMRPGGLEIPLPLRPTRRGELRLAASWVRWGSPFGLWRRQSRVAHDEAVAIVPDLEAVHRAAATSQLGRRGRAGSRPEDMAGEGSEFDALREFQAGQDTRSIHWRASARHRLLLSREYRHERDQPVVLALDCSYLMSEPLGRLTRLDHGIHAALLLAWAALREGDRVGLLAFDERPRHYLPPGRGPGQFPRLLEACARLRYDPGEANFSLALAELGQRLRRRTLVVVMTDYVDPVGAELLHHNLGQLARKHLVLFVALRDPRLAAGARAEPVDPPALASAVVHGELLQQRREVTARLRRQGVLVVDAPAGEVHGELLNRYLRVKQRELIG